MDSSWRFSTSPFSSCSATSASATMSLSPSASPSSIRVRASSRSCSSLRKPSIPSSSEPRSRISFCAASASFQRLGSSERAFSSSSRLTALSQSKMPPQQGQRLPNVVHRRLDLCTHRKAPCLRDARGGMASPGMWAGRARSKCYSLKCQSSFARGDFQPPPEADFFGGLLKLQNVEQFHVQHRDHLVNPIWCDLLYQTLRLAYRVRRSDCPQLAPVRRVSRGRPPRCRWSPCRQPAGARPRHCRGRYPARPCRGRTPP